MSKFRIGRVEGVWENFLPPIQGGAFRKCADKESKESLEATKGSSIVSESSTLEMPAGTYTTNEIEKEIAADVAKYPSLDSATQRDITLKFRALHQRVHDEGYYDCRYIEYGKEMARYSALFALFIFFLKMEYYTTSACFLGLWWHQIMVRP
jgi:delta8-fatty-acid desaturase